MIYKIPLGQGKFALVDKDDVMFLCQWNWYYCKGYAIRHGRIVGVQKTIYMNRVILELKLGHSDFEIAHHINEDRADNRSENLQAMTRGQHKQTHSIREGGTSEYIGVCWHERAGKWCAQIQVDGKNKHLGLFVVEINAARAYDLAAIEYYGESATLNFDRSDYLQEPMILGSRSQ